MTEQETEQVIEKNSLSLNADIGHKRFWQGVAWVVAGITVGLLLLRSIV